MPNAPAQLVDVAKSIQLALAPVFLLTGIAGLLNVMAGRLARIIDRGRVLTETRDLFLPPLQFIAALIGLPLAAFLAWYLYVSYVTQDLQARCALTVAIPQPGGEESLN